MGLRSFFIAVEQRADNLHQLAAFGLYAEENGGEELVVGLGEVSFSRIFLATSVSGSWLSAA